MSNELFNEDLAGCEIVTQAAKVWKKAQVLYMTPYWEGGPAASAFVREITTRFRDCEDAVAELLFNENQLVVAYALVTLRFMGSEKLLSLPPELLENRSKITTITGSFSIKTTLGAVARQNSKMVKYRRETP